MMLPHMLTLLRAASAPLLFGLLVFERLDEALALLVFAAITDLIDGPLVRRFGSPSRAGAYFDAWADFLVVAAAFSGFAVLEIYPAWLVGLIALSFILFIVSARFTPTIYDPLGRYIGGLLYVAAWVTLVYRDFLAQHAIFLIVLGAFGVKFGGRCAFVYSSLRVECRRG